MPARAYVPPPVQALLGSAWRLTPAGSSSHTDTLAKEADGITRFHFQKADLPYVSPNRRLRQGRRAGIYLAGSFGLP
jgi:hypothetical protein